MTVDSSSKTNSIGLALAEIMVDNENHYALKTALGTLRIDARRFIAHQH